MRYTGSYETLQTVYWTGHELVAAGRYGAMFISSDGSEWNRIPHFTDANILGFANNPERYVAVRDSGVIYTSTDLENW